MTVEYPPVIKQDRGPENMFDGDVLEFDHSMFRAKPGFSGTESTPQR